MPKPKLWILKDTVVYKGTYVRMVRRSFANRQTGKRGIWEMVQRNTHGRIVAIVALTPKNEVILTKIWRVPFRGWIIESCAGLADKKGESEKALARRELLEETGYAVKNIRKIVAGPFNAGLLADEIVFYLGTGAKKIREPQMENAEDIEVLKVPLQKLYRFLTQPPRGTKVDMKLFGILYFLQKRFLKKVG